VIASRAAAALLVACLATAARAVESPRYGSFDLMAGTYLPNIDSEFSLKPGQAGPWEKSMGGARDWMFRGGGYWAPYYGWGTVELGGQIGFYGKTGQGFLLSGAQSGDSTAFRILPVSAVVTYRLDQLGPNGYVLPIAPYIRLALERYWWWVNDGTGKTTKVGATNGFSAALGACLLLDWLDPDAARTMDNNTGINHTYAFAELRKTNVNDFGSKKSWDLSDRGNQSWSFGLLFVY
jgi:hypothetical protein